LPGGARFGLVTDVGCRRCITCSATNTRKRAYLALSRRSTLNALTLATGQSPNKTHSESLARLIEALSRRERTAAARAGNPDKAQIRAWKQAHAYAYEIASDYSHPVPLDPGVEPHLSRDSGAENVISISHRMRLSCTPARRFCVACACIDSI